MGNLHKAEMAKIKKKARYSRAFEHAATAYGYCSFNYIRNTPPHELYRLIMGCMAKIWGCHDSHRAKRSALNVCAKAYLEVQRNAQRDAYIQAIGVHNAGKLNCAMPEDWGNAMGAAEKEDGKWVRRFECVSLDAVYYSGNDNNDLPDSDTNSFDAGKKPLTDAVYQFDGEIESTDIGEIECYDEEGNHVYRPENNTQCF